MLPAGVYNTRYEQDMAIVRTKNHWAWLLGLFVLLLVLPFFLPQRFFAILIITGYTIITMHGLNIVTGYCGQISLGQSAFMGVGAVTSGAIVVQGNLPCWLALPAGGLVASIFCVVFGAPSLRIKGFYLALATLAAHFVILFIIHRLPQFGGEIGQVVPKAAIGPIVFDTDTKYYYLTMFLVVIMTFLAKNLARTNTGRAFVAVRDNDLAAGVMGINVFAYKVLAFAISAFFAGIAGVVLTFYMGMASTQYFTLMDSIWYLGFLVVGGLGSTTGAIFGALFYRFVEEIMTYFAPALTKVLPFLVPEFATGLAMVLYGLIITVFLIFEPRGLYHRWEIVKAFYQLHPYSY